LIHSIQIEEEERAIAIKNKRKYRIMKKDLVALYLINKKQKLN